MTRILSRGSIPSIDLKTYGFGGLQFTIFLNSYSISFDNFFTYVYRFITEEPLDENDMRCDIVKYLKTLKQAAGYPAFRRGKKLKTIRYASEGEKRKKGVRKKKKGVRSLFSSCAVF